MVSFGGEGGQVAGVSHVALVRTQRCAGLHAGSGQQIQRAVARAGATGVAHIHGHQQAVAVLHQGIGQITQLRLLALAAQLRVRVGGGCVRAVAALLAVEIVPDRGFGAQGGCTASATSAGIRPSGAVFERSKLPLTTWSLAVHQLTGSKTNMAALELKRHLGVCYDITLPGKTPSSPANSFCS